MTTRYGFSLKLDCDNAAFDDGTLIAHDLLEHQNGQGPTMTKFLVPITRDCTETTMVDVIAESAEAARDAALAEAEQSPENFDWVADECSGGQSEPYFAGDDDLDAIEEVQ